MKMNNKTISIIVFLLVTFTLFGGIKSNKSEDEKKIKNLKKPCVISEFDEDSESDINSGKVIFNTSEVDLDYDIENSIKIDSYKERFSEIDVDDCPCGDCDEGDGKVWVATSHDPNDILGPVGYGDQNYVAGIVANVDGVYITNNMKYTIRFENDPEFATAPAQEVFIVQEIDPDLNLSSFRVGNFGFGDYIFEVTTTKPYYQTRIDLVDSLGIYLDFYAGTDQLNNKIFWALRSIDPETGLTPEDPMKGFLQVNNDDGIGEGFVTYTIRPKPEGTVVGDETITTGTVITAQADIVFDVNAPILTPQIMHTLDFEKPVSKMISSDYISEGVYDVSWGVDYTPIGSGIKDYTIYYSKDDNPYEVWVANTPETNALFQPVEDGLYKFFSIARSNVNIIEDYKPEDELEQQVGDEINLEFLVDDYSIILNGTEDVVLTESDNLTTFTETDILTFENKTLGTPMDVGQIIWKIVEYDSLNVEINDDQTQFFLTPKKDINGQDYLKIIAMYNDISDTLGIIANFTPVPDDPEVVGEDEYLTKQVDFKTFEINLNRHFRDGDKEDILFYECVADDSSDPLAIYDLVDSILTISSITGKTGIVNLTILADDEAPTKSLEITRRNKSVKSRILRDRSSSEDDISAKDPVSKTITLDIKFPDVLPFISTTIPDITQDVNFPVITIDLTEHFKTSEGNTITYDITCEPENIVTISQSDNFLKLISISDVTGETIVSITATDEVLTTTTSDEFKITIESITSAPLTALFGDVTVYLAMANYSDEAESMKSEFELTDDLLISILNDSGQEETLNAYLSAGNHVTYLKFIEDALESYFNTMSNGNLNLDIQILESPEDNKIWRIDTKSHYEAIPSYTISSNIISDLENRISTNFSYAPIIENGKSINETVYLAYILPDFDSESYNLRGNDIYIQMDEGVSFEKTTRILTRELSQILLGVGKKDYSVTGPYFDGILASNPMGRTESSTGPYDLMYQCTAGYDVSPYSLYGLNPIHSSELISQGYFGSVLGIAKETAINEEGQNSFTFILKNYDSTTKICKEEKESLYSQAVKIPINTDINDTGDTAYPSGSMTEEQYFLVEFKDSKGFNELSPFDQQDQSKGVLISHVINSDAIIQEMNISTSIIDIESALPFPDGYKTPNTGELFYKGKEVNDWLDDFNTDGVTLEGGPSDTGETYGACSLPTDFFNDTDRNIFSPLTRPSSISWKLNDTHVGVFIDEINYEENYADIRVYRNYWSKLIEEGVPKTISGDGYIGENLSIETGGILTIAENSIVTLVPNTKMIIESGATLKLLDGSQLIVDAGATLKLNFNALVETGSGTKITIRDGGTLTSGEQSSFVGTDTWEGIVAEIGSTVSMYFTSISNATWGVNAQASEINLTRTSFSNCDNGIWLLNCDNYDLYDCYFNGKGSGTGIRVTESTGVLKSNTVLNHSSGIVAVSCSPLITENYIYENVTCGIALYGYNTYPQLINPASTNDDLNNRIIDNGLTTTGENGSQIFMMYRANAYLNNGYNNIYSGVENSIPVVPCIKTISDMTVNQQKVEISQMVKIPAEYNYWGTEEILDVNRSEYFDLWVDIPKGYSIDYDPYATSAFDPGLPQPPHYSTNEPTTQEEILLKVAMLLEDKGNFKPSIKKYEDIIEKYPDSDEYYVATSRLPQVLVKDEESLEPLLKTYDDAIVSEEISNKKFIKQMKVSTNIKSKKYDEAIALAVELKTEAENDAEKDLCDIEIAICNMMKTAENTAKIDKVDYLALINQLITNLMDDDIGKKIGNNLPTEFKLHNNYPNPFNPITTIKYDLPSESNVKINIYNIRGAKVDQLVNGTIPAGYHKAQFNASRFSNGLYYYTFEINNKVKDVKKMLLIK